MFKTRTSRTALLFGAAMLLATTAVGVTLAASPGRHHGRGEASETDGQVGPRRFASEHGARRHEGRQEDRHERHAEADHDDDDEGGQHGGPGPRMADPNAPVPDNGLFNGKARPKVDVQ
jgi:hypothetical protein